MSASSTFSFSLPALIAMEVAILPPLSLSLWMSLRSRGASLPGCGGGSGCDAVIKSRWARWGPLPVSIIGSILYATIVLTPLSIALNDSGGWDGVTGAVLKTAALIATGGALWFFGLQALVLRRFCFFCSLIHCCAVVASAIIFVELGIWQQGVVSAEYGIAVLALTTLIVGQIVTVPKTYAVTTNTPITTPKPQSAGLPQNATTTPADRSFTGRRIRLDAGRIELNVDDWPIMGSATARHVIAWLFDHTCAECHRQHRQLLEILHQHEHSLSVLAIPIPMHSSCNPATQCKDSERFQACAYARLSWGVWLAGQKGDYQAWDQFMAQEPACQPFGLALAKASSLVDIGQFKIRETDPVLDEKLLSGIGVYQRSMTDTIPAILLPGGILKGRAASADELFAIIKKHLARPIATAPVIG